MPNMLSAIICWKLKQQHPVRYSVDPMMLWCWMLLADDAGRVSTRLELPNIKGCCATVHTLIIRSLGSYTFLRATLNNSKCFLKTARCHKEVLLSICMAQFSILSYFIFFMLRSFGECWGWGRGVMTRKRRPVSTDFWLRNGERLDVTVLALSEIKVKFVVIFQG